MKQTTKTHLKNLVYQVNGAAIEVSKALGPGLLESVYHKCMKHELTQRGIHFESEVAVPVIYKGARMNVDLRCDLLVDRLLVVELKSVDHILPIHEAQLLTYMNLICLIWFKLSRHEKNTFIHRNWTGLSWGDDELPKEEKSATSGRKRSATPNRCFAMED